MEVIDPKPALERVEGPVATPVEPRHVHWAGSAHRLADAFVAAFDPPEMIGEAPVRLARAVLVVRLIATVAALGAPFLPAEQRVTYLSLIAFVWLPAGLAQLALARWAPGRLTRLAGFLMDLLVIFAFQVWVPGMGTVVLFGHIFFQAYHAVIGGRVAGLVYGVAATGLTLATRALVPIADRPNGFTILIFASVMLVMAFLLDASAREQRAAAATLRRAYEQERAAATRFRELDQLKNEFVAIVAHDLRSPMAVISGFAGILRTHWDRLDEQAKGEHLETIARTAERVVELVEDILQVAQIEAGELSFEIETFDLRDELRRAPELAPTERDRVRVHLPDGPMPVVADRSHQWRVLCNLVANALKFSDDRVDISVRERAGFYEVAVRDRGPGIAPEDLTRLFQRFSRIANPRSKGAPGTGLGLYICRSMIEAQGGTIWAVSGVGQGSTFSYTVRRAP